MAKKSTTKKKTTAKAVKSSPKKKTTAKAFKTPVKKNVVTPEQKVINKILALKVPFEKKINSTPKLKAYITDEKNQIELASKLENYIMPKLTKSEASAILRNISKLKLIFSNDVDLSTVALPELKAIFKAIKLGLKCILGIKLSKSNSKDKKHSNPLVSGALKFKYDPEEVLTIPETGKKVKCKDLPLRIVINLKSK